MRRYIVLAVAMLTGLSATGCALPGWYRAIGHYPGIASSDYAFYDFCGISSQVFQFPIDAVQRSSIEALRDLGFKDLGPGETCKDDPEAIVMTATAPDNRIATITFSPQNAMTNMRITFSPLHVGDQTFSREILRRVALNFGTLPRDYMPMEPTLARRGGTPAPSMRPALNTSDPPVTLDGEGLRPNQNRDAVLTPEFSSPVTGTGSGVIPPPYDPTRPGFLSNPAFPYLFGPNSPMAPFPP